MARVPTLWRIEDLFEGDSLVIPAIRAVADELVPSRSGKIFVSGTRVAPVRREVVRSLDSIQRVNDGVVLRLAAVPGVLERTWRHPPLSLLLDSLTLRREDGNLDAEGALARLAGPAALARRAEWDHRDPLERRILGGGTMWQLDS